MKKNRDYPLAPTYMNGGGEDPVKKKLRKQVTPSPDARKPKRDTVKRELTPEEMGVITRKQKNQATVGELKAKGVSASTLAPYLKRLQMSTDSANVVYQKAWGPKKGK